MKIWNVTVKTDFPNEFGCYETTISVLAKNAGDAMSKAAKRLNEEEINCWLLVAPADYEE